MKKIWLIIKYDFDNIENHRGEAMRETIIGYYDNYDNAVNFIQSSKQEKIYKGWDNNEYPWYEIRPIKCLEKNNEYKLDEQDWN